jgi:hypothetical protein
MTNNLTKVSTISVILALADNTMSTKALSRMLGVSSFVGKVMNGETESLEEIDEALAHASRTRNSTTFNQRQRDIIDQFINELLDTRLEMTKC